MIPKILHFCWGMDLGGKPWSLIHHVCVRSAVERIKPSTAYLYYQYEPRGAWWRLTREIITPMKVGAPRVIFGNPVLHPAHSADVLRLEKLLESGGIYLDCDMFVHRDFDDLLQHSTVLGQQVEGQALGNAVICAERQAPFLKRWYASYKTFRSRGADQHWDEHSVKIPYRLAKEFPGEITVLPAVAFFWPGWDEQGINRIFNSAEPIAASGRYANHLWEGASWRPFLEDLTPGGVRSKDSNFHYWVRPMVATLPDNFGAPAIVSRAIRNGARAAGLGRVRRMLLARLRSLSNRRSSAGGTCGA